MQSIKAPGLFGFKHKDFKFASYTHVDARVQKNSNTATLIEWQMNRYLVSVRVDL